MKQAIPIMAVIQRVEMNPPMHICLCLWRSLISLTLFMKSSIPPSISLTFSKSDCSWVVIDFIIFVEFSLFFKKVSSNKLCLAPVYLLPANVQVMMYFSQSCRAIIYDKMSINFLSKLTQPIYRPLEICMDLQNVNGFYFKIWAILYTEIYVLLILDQAGPLTLFRC